MTACRKRTAACLRKLMEDFFDYETPVMLRTKAKRVGIIYRIIQTVILTFFFLYSIVYLKGYQLISDSAASVILTRIQGEPHDKFSELVYDEKFLEYCRLEIESNNPDDSLAYFHGGRDIFIPVSFALMTQKQTRCPEDPNVPNAKCDTVNNRCVKHMQLPMGNGKMTGKCVPAIITNDTVCEVFAWCPVISSLTPIVNVPQNDSEASDKESGTVDIGIEDQLSQQKDDDRESTTNTSLEPEPLEEEQAEGIDAILDLAHEAESRFYGSNGTEHGGNGTEELHDQFIRLKLWTSIRNVTIVLKNPVVFSAFKQSRSNYNTSGIPCWRDPNYDMITNHCPIFSVEDILEEVAGKIDNLSAEDLVQTGGIISGLIDWECNFDIRDKDKSCNIEYTFARVDEPRSGVGERLLLLSDNESGDPVTKRIAIKVSFIRFIFNVQVRAGKFDAIELLLKLGAVFGLFSIASLLCEYVFLNTDWLVKRTVVEMKYLEPGDGKPRTKGLVVVQSELDDQKNG